MGHAHNKSTTLKAFQREKLGYPLIVSPALFERLTSGLNRQILIYCSSFLLYQQLVLHSSSFIQNALCATNKNTVSQTNAVSLYVIWFSG